MHTRRGHAELRAVSVGRPAVGNHRRSECTARHGRRRCVVEAIEALARRWVNLPRRLVLLLLLGRPKVPGHVPFRDKAAVAVWLRAEVEVTVVESHVVEFGLLCVRPRHRGRRRGVKIEGVQEIDVTESKRRFWRRRRGYPAWRGRPVHERRQRGGRRGGMGDGGCEKKGKRARRAMWGANDEAATNGESEHKRESTAMQADGRRIYERRI